MNDLVYAHMSPTEVRALERLQGGAEVDGQGTPEFGKLGHAFRDPQVVAKFMDSLRMQRATGGKVGKRAIDEMRKNGRFGDTKLVKLHPEMVHVLDKTIGHSRNPKDGHPEYFLGALLGGLGSSLLGGLAKPIMSGLSSLGGSLLKPAMGAMSRGVGSLASGMVGRGARALGKHAFKAARQEASRMAPQLINKGAQALGSRAQKWLGGGQQQPAVQQQAAPVPAPAPQQRQQMPQQMPQQQGMNPYMMQQQMPQQGMNPMMQQGGFGMSPMMGMNPMMGGMGMSPYSQFQNPMMGGMGMSPMMGMNPMMSRMNPMMGGGFRGY